MCKVETLLSLMAFVAALLVLAIVIVALDV